MAVFETFPKDIVWIPGAYGLWTHRPKTRDDETRRSLVLRLLYTPRAPKGMHFNLEQLSEIATEKAHVRRELDKLPKPYE